MHIEDHQRGDKRPSLFPYQARKYSLMKKFTEKSGDEKKLRRFKVLVLSGHAENRKMSTLAEMGCTWLDKKVSLFIGQERVLRPQ